MSISSQSKGINPYPINLSYKTANKVGEIALKWCNYNNTPKKMKLTNTGKTVMLSGKWYQERPYIQDGPLNDRYVFSQIHFHWGATDFDGSEHRIEGQKYPMEMHIVHFNTKYETLEEAKYKTDGIAVVVFFMKVEERANPSMQPIVIPLGEIDKVFKSVHIEPFPLSNLNFNLFETGYFLYCGTVGKEGKPHLILWLIYPETITISHAQLSRFREMESISGDSIKSNVHELQPVLNPDGVFFVDRIISDKRERESSLFCFTSLDPYQFRDSITSEIEDNQLFNLGTGTSYPVNKTDPNKQFYRQGSVLQSLPETQQRDKAYRQGSVLQSLTETQQSDQPYRQRSVLQSYSEPQQIDPSKPRKVFETIPGFQLIDQQYRQGAVLQPHNEFQQIVLINRQGELLNSGSEYQKMHQVNEEREVSQSHPEYHQIDQAHRQVFPVLNQFQTANISSKETVQEPYFKSLHSTLTSMPTYVPGSIYNEKQKYLLSATSGLQDTTTIEQFAPSTVSLRDAKGSTAARISSMSHVPHEKYMVPIVEQNLNFDDSGISIGEAKGSTDNRPPPSPGNVDIISIISNRERTREKKDTEDEEDDDYQKEPFGARNIPIELINSLLTTKVYASMTPEERKTMNAPIPKLDSSITKYQRKQTDQAGFGTSDISLKECKGSTVKRMDSFLTNKYDEKLQMSILNVPVYRSDNSLKEARSSTPKRIG